MAQTTRAKARGGAIATIDHDEIRRWVEERGGKPAVVKRTANGRQPGILRIDFPGFSGEQSLEELGWDEWFERFDSANLAFLHQDETGSGRPSRFNKLVARDSVEMSDGASSARRSSGARSARRGGTATRGAKAKKAAAAGGRGKARNGRTAEGRSSSGSRGQSRSSSGTKRGAARGSSGTKRGASRASSRTAASGSSGSSRGKRGGSRGSSRTQSGTKRGSKGGRSRAGGK